jgi:hypothetical protein
MLAFAQFISEDPNLEEQRRAIHACPDVVELLTGHRRRPVDDVEEAALEVIEDRGGHAVARISRGVAIEPSGIDQVGRDDLVTGDVHRIASRVDEIEQEALRLFEVIADRRVTYSVRVALGPLMRRSRRRVLRSMPGALDRQYVSGSGGPSSCGRSRCQTSAG